MRKILFAVLVVCAASVAWAQVATTTILCPHCGKTFLHAQEEVIEFEAGAQAATDEVIEITLPTEPENVYEMALVALADDRGWTALIDDPDDPEGPQIPNPVSRADFADATAIGMIESAIRTSNFKKAERDAAVAKEVENTKLKDAEGKPRIKVKRKPKI